MNLAVWAERNGVAWVIAYRWFRAGLLPVPAQRVGRLILVNDPAVEESGRGRTLVYARVSSADQRSDLDRRVARVTAWATSQHLSVDKVVAEGGWALNGHRRKFFALLGDPVVTRIVWSTGIGSAGLALSTSRPLLSPRAGNWWWSTWLRLMTTWWAI